LKATVVVPQHPLEMILARELSSHVAVPMVLVDADGEVVYANDSARPFLRGSSEGSERVGSVSEVFLTEDGHPGLEPFRSVLREGRPAHARLYVKTDAEALPVVLITVFPVGGESGCQVGVVGIFWEDLNPPSSGALAREDQS
jgi:PAS domain-containing protein